MKNRKNNVRFPLYKQYIIGITAVLTVLSFSLLYIFNMSMDPYQSARANSIRAAKEYADMTRVDSFSLYNGQKSYYSLLGQNDEKTKLAVLIEKDSDKMYIYELEKGLSQKKAESIARKNGAKSIDKVTFGYLNGKPIWEVKSGSAYYIVGFQSKTLLSKEGL